MKTSLAIVLATAALMVGATVDAANAGYSNKGAGLSGAVALPNIDQAPRPFGDRPGPYRGQM
jgi:hypothetical protein